ncbi:DM13 domain-containing protein [Parvularcula sp. ZS-1/3]|uniref:DM13 domain-containing protein n=1 Tax=Parvularcula mediterranea TaxID=2732508 RepID=A0A7Y3W5B1_9PROT|nr:DM13 domain-containing protein [Parvularcula mediterranea]NNU16117.1 DM13 domain-containing protein [Parvularcula mediterranea]
MKRLLLAASAALTVGTVLIPQASFAASTVAVQEAEVLLSGSFEGREGKQGRGTARIILEGGKLFLEFEDFRTSRGPQLEVWIAAGPVRSNSEAEAASYLELAPLQSARQKSQRYELPADFDLDDAKSIVIWCKPFRILFASAELS